MRASTPSCRRPSRRAAPVLACLGLLAGLWGGGAQAESPATSTAAASSQIPPPPDLSQMPDPAPARRDKAPAAKPAAAKPEAKAAATETAPVKPAATTPTTQAGPSEPVVQRSVFEDDGSRIEETRVRGRVQRITVTPKVGTTVSYEILPGDGSGSEASRSTAGKRVWNVLQF